jgi:hypothetical protein
MSRRDGHRMGRGAIRCSRLTCQWLSAAPQAESHLKLVVEATCRTRDPARCAMETPADLMWRLEGTAA